jgi:ribosomal protein L11 methylase PrmA
MPCAIEAFNFVRQSGLFDKLLANGWLVPFEEADPSVLGELTAQPSLVLEHPRLPFISYPYEWPFSALKEAALHHLKVHLLALEHGVTMSDASAYNIQFKGGTPVFIDHLSFVPLEDGGFWKGHRQFSEQFLNPLLLRAFLGIPHNAWYRGNLEGIPTDHLSRLMPFRRKLSFNVLMHVTLPARFQRTFSDTGSVKEINAAKTAKLPLATLRRMLQKLAGWIERLEPLDGKTEWSDYAEQNSYDDSAADMKRGYIESFVADTQPAMVWDLGCNTGDYSVAALDAGAGHVVGFDVDQGALDRGFERVRREKIEFLPLYFDAANPAPDQGWGQEERNGMLKRAPADGVLALALVHHLAISCNIPVSRITQWLTRIGKAGVVEFVPKSDPMVKRLLQLREDIFPDYTADRFLEALKADAEIVDIAEVPNSDRSLIRFRSNPGAQIEGVDP